jgi:hypothetical protein
MGRREQAQRERVDEHADREVDEEDPVPAEDVGQDPAREDADHAPAGQDEAEDAHRLRAVRLLGEERHEQRQRDRRDDGAADALYRPRRDEQPLRGREAAAEGREREDGDADQEEAAVPEQVAEPATEEQEAAEGQQVRVHHPGERRLREAEVVADRRQGDVHDRAVEDDHQVAEAEHVEREPAHAGVECHLVACSSRGFRVGFTPVRRPLARELIAAAHRLSRCTPEPA